MTTPIVTMADAEDIVVAWLKTTPVVDLAKIFLTAQGNPLPRIMIDRVGGAPRNSDLSEDLARISFQIYSLKRTEAKRITLALVSEILSLAYTGDVVTPVGVLVAAEIANWIWLPDPESQTSRYVVDARVVTRAN